MTNILDTIAQGESENVEFKTSFNNDALITINAFANSKGGRLFIIFKGTSFKQYPYRTF